VTTSLSLAAATPEAASWPSALLRAQRSQLGQLQRPTWWPPHKQSTAGLGHWRRFLTRPARPDASKQRATQGQRWLTCRLSIAPLSGADLDRAWASSPTWRMQCQDWGSRPRTCSTEESSTKGLDLVGTMGAGQHMGEASFIQLCPRKQPPPFKMSAYSPMITRDRLAPCACHWPKAARAPVPCLSSEGPNPGRHASMHPCIHASMHPCIHASMHPCIHASMHPRINVPPSQRCASAGTRGRRGASSAVVPPPSLATIGAGIRRRCQAYGHTNA
jgi:hypothetical protein